MAQDNMVKKTIIDYIFKSIQLSKFRLKSIDNEEDLKYLKDHVHYVSPHYNGYSYLLVFTRKEHNNYGYYIDRKNLKFKKEHVHLEEIKLQDTNLNAHVDTYDGTLIDGIFINKNTFLIMDVYMLAGETLYDDDMKNKLLKAQQYFDTYIDTTYSDVEFHFNIYYKYYDLKNLVYNTMTKSKWPTKGLIFHPAKSGVKYYYYFTMESIKNTKYAVFTVRKTDIPDVYDIFLYDKKNTLKKYGIAYVPGKQISHQCKKLFEENTSDDKGKKELIMKCKYAEEQNKWIPEEISKKKTDTLEFVKQVIS